MKTAFTILRPITDRQKAVWRAVCDHYERERTGCGVRDVCALLGFSSPNGAWSHLKRLRANGWVEWREGKANSILPSRESLEADDAAT